MAGGKKVFVTGGAGFIGSNLVEVLVSKGHEVTVYDNLSLGKKEYIQDFVDKGKCRFIEADLLDVDRVKKSVKGMDVVFHMAANSDIAEGEQVTDTDLKQGTIATYNVLEAMRTNRIREVVFASSSAIFGDAGLNQIHEDYGPMLPISLYGAGKLACEGLITAFCHNFEMRAWIYRFANVVGDNATHGCIHDFVDKLLSNPRVLKILGNGKQAKPYLYVKDCVDGMFYGYEHSSNTVNYFNLGTSGATSVDTIADIVVEEMGLSGVKYEYTGGDRGWKSDVPQVRFDVSKLTRLGWTAKYSSDDAVRVAARRIIEQRRD